MSSALAYQSQLQPYAQHSSDPRSLPRKNRRGGTTTSACTVEMRDTSPCHAQQPLGRQTRSRSKSRMAPKPITSWETARPRRTRRVSARPSIHPFSYLSCRRPEPKPHSATAVPTPSVEAPPSAPLLSPSYLSCRRPEPKPHSATAVPTPSVKAPPSIPLLSQTYLDRCRRYPFQSESHRSLGYRATDSYIDTRSAAKLGVVCHAYPMPIELRLFDGTPSSAGVMGYRGRVV